MSDAQREEIDHLWRRYKERATRELRDQLILHYSPLVKYVAGRVAVGLPQNVDQADLVSYGIFGLIDAIEKFDPGRGFRFETYAISRIKGAILDELRSIDWVPRSVRTKARAIESAYAKLEAVHHRTPSDAELAEELDLTVDRLQSTLSQISFVGLAALDEILSVGGERGESMTLGDTIADSGDGPMAAFEVAEIARHAGRRHAPPARARAHRAQPLLLRGPHPRPDRADPGRHRESDLPDPHPGGAPAALAAQRRRP